ncbi:major facilitator superfamily domain-containing protein [Aspergillus karnatakaensis]|uniref:major facilitator superfamily domain-containing protein n=1 Tax=Aspergillus karnatakaensis TaxID=1810916 RepID=UPI003CCDB358
MADRKKTHQEIHTISESGDEDSSVTNEQLARHGLRLDAQTGHIRWLNDSKDHPRNWTTLRKTYDTSLVMFLEFYTTVISTTGASAAELAMQDYQHSKMTLLVAFSLMYQLGQAMGGLIIPPSSDLFGRRMPYILSCLLFSVSCLVVGVVPHVSAVFVGRFFSGLASAVPSVVVSGTVEDQFNTERRVWIVLLWNAAATAGLAFGPVYSSCITSVASWRWIFYSAAIGTGVCNVLLLGIRESRPSKLLARKIAAIRGESPNAELRYHTTDPFPTVRVFMEVVFVRSTVMMVTEPILIIVSSMSAISWGLIYLFTESLIVAFTALDLSPTEATWPFLALIVGVILDALPHIWEVQQLRAKRQKNATIEPEDKITGFTYGTIALAAGLWWFYSTTPPAMTHAHYMLPTAALVLIGFGVNEIAYTMSGYLTDTYTVYAASAFAGLAFVRAVVAGLGPIVGHLLFTGTQSVVPGYVIAALGTVFCAVPFFFFRAGRRLRERSSFAQYSLEMHHLTRVEEA